MSRLRSYFLFANNRGMNKDVIVYNDQQQSNEKEICEALAKEIMHALPDGESKVWHGSPVWFLDGNPVAGFSVLKDGAVQLLFWSGQSFDEPELKAVGSNKAAEARYASVDQINKEDLARWLKKCQDIQWDYKNIVKRKGVLERLK